jgi:hypothetical protein
VREILGETAAEAVIEIGIGDVREVEVEIGIERGRGVEVGVVDGNLEGIELLDLLALCEYDALGRLSKEKSLP